MKKKVGSILRVIFSRILPKNPIKKEESPKINKKKQILIRFYDNDIKHINKFKEHFPEIESIIVDDTIPNELIVKYLKNGKSINIMKKNMSNSNRRRIIKSNPKAYPLEYLRKYYSNKNESNKYLELFIRENVTLKKIPSCGITKNQLKNLLKWLETPNSEKFLFLDWDRTISVFEGLIIPKKGSTWKNNQLPNYNNYDIVSYLLGGRERVDTLKKVFQVAHNNGVSIYIISNNSALSKKNNEANRELFLQLIQIIMPFFTDDHIIGAYDNERNKVVALREYLDNTNSNNVNSLKKYLYKNAFRRELLQSAGKIIRLKKKKMTDSKKKKKM
jgi:hypothetical protein